MIEKLKPGIMFHHFCSLIIKTPGALSKTLFKTKLKKLSKNLIYYLLIII